VSHEQRFLVALGLLLIAVCALTGCAGSEALRWYPAYQPPCGIKVCVPQSVTGKIDPEKDCECSGKTSLEDIFR
jgi:hypothetical protein